MGAEDVGVDERVGPVDRAVDMAFGGEMHQRADAVVAKQAFDERRVPDVADDELGFRPGKAGAVAGIGQRVEHDDCVIGVSGFPMPDKIGPDEAGSAGDEQVSHARSLSCSHAAPRANALPGL